VTDNHRFPFSDAKLEALRPRAKRFYARDARTHGLLLTVHPSGRKVFSLYRKINGRPERITLGTFPDLDTHGARAQADQMNAAIAQGGNPADIARDRRTELTFEAFFNEYMERYAKPRKRTWQDDQEQFDRYLKHWRNLKVSAIRRADVAAVHAKLGAKHPYAANRLLALVRSMFNRAHELGWPVVENPAKGIRRFPEHSRERFLTPSEMGPFFVAVLSEPNEVIRDFVLMLIFTGARRGNVAAMQWSEIDLKEAVWRIPHTKSGAPVTISLTREALKILEARREAVSPDCPWVFPSYGDTGHIVEVKATWKRILHRAGIADLRLHDIRRTVGSWMAAGGVSLPIIGRALGHKTPQATAIYARLDVNPVRRSLEQAQRAMLAAAGKLPE
jgi:integrase